MQVWKLIKHELFIKYFVNNKFLCVERDILARLMVMAFSGILSCMFLCWEGNKCDPFNQGLFQNWVVLKWLVRKWFRKITTVITSQLANSVFYVRLMVWYLITACFPHSFFALLSTEKFHSKIKTALLVFLLHVS